MQLIQLDYLHYLKIFYLDLNLVIEIKKMNSELAESSKIVDEILKSKKLKADKSLLSFATLQSDLAKDEKYLTQIKKANKLEQKIIDKHKKSLSYLGLNMFGTILTENNDFSKIDGGGISFFNN